jgi:hypothetical protein
VPSFYLNYTILSPLTGRRLSHHVYNVLAPARRRSSGPEIRPDWPSPAPHRGVFRGLPGGQCRLLGGRQPFPHCDFDGGQGHHGRLVRLDPHWGGHPSEAPSDHRIQGADSFSAFPCCSWPVFDVTSTAFSGEVHPFDPPSIAIPRHNPLSIGDGSHRQGRQQQPFNGLNPLRGLELSRQDPCDGQGNRCRGRAMSGSSKADPRSFAMFRSRPALADSVYAHR